MASKELSAFERRKLYWKNMAPPSKGSSQPDVRQNVQKPASSSSAASGSVADRNLAPRKIVAARRAPTAPQVAVGRTAKAVPMSGRPSAAAAAAPGRGNVPQRKHKLDVAEEPPSKRFKVPAAAPPNRRATVATFPLPGRWNPPPPPKGVRPRLSVAPAVLAPRAKVKRTPQPPPVPLKRKRNFRDVPSRTESGLKRRATQVPVVKQVATPSVSAVARTKITLEKPLEAIGVSSSLNKTPKGLVRRQNTFELAEPSHQLVRQNAEGKIGTTPHVKRRGSFTISSSANKESAVGGSPALATTADSVSKESAVGGSPALATTADSGSKEKRSTPNTAGEKEEKTLQEGNVEEASGEVRVGRQTRASAKACKTGQVEVRSGLLKECSPVAESLPRKTPKRSRKSKPKVMKVEISDSPSGNINEPTGTTKEEIEDAGLSGEIENVFEVKRVVRLTEQSHEDCRAVLLEKDEQNCGQTRSNQAPDTLLEPAIPVKVPKSALKKGKVQAHVRTPVPSKRKSLAPVVGDQENVPPASCGRLKSGKADSKRSTKSVSFHVTSDDSKVPATLPKTPRANPSLRQKLEHFLEEKGYSASRHRHLRCFGVDLSEMKQKPGSRLMFRAATPSQVASPSLKSRRSAATPHSVLTPEPNLSVEQKICGILNDMKYLLLKGQPVAEGEEWLAELERHAPAIIEDQAPYWVVKALLEEQAGRLHRALDIFTEAVERNVQPTDDLSQALEDFMGRVSSMEAREEASAQMQPLEEEQAVAGTSVENATSSSIRRSTRRPRRCTPARKSLHSSAKMGSGGNAEGRFESTVTKYTMQDTSAIQNLNVLLGQGSSPKILALLTPVRRSTRVTRSTGRKSRRSFAFNELPSPIQQQVLCAPNNPL